MSTANNILLVEDHALLAVMLENELEGAGYENVYTCNSEQTAIQMVDDKNFAFALLDFHLGDQENSTSVAKKLKDNGTPFVFITGYSSATRIVPNDLGEIGWINKPFKFADILKLLKTHIPSPAV